MNGLTWLASYHKSGNTWLRLFLSSLAQGGKAIDINGPEVLAPMAYGRAQFQHLADVDAADLTDDEIAGAWPDICRGDASEGKPPLLRKVHDAWAYPGGWGAHYPADVTAGVIYIVRDPRDVAVSLAHHMGRDVDWVIDLMADPHAALSVRKNRLPRHISARLQTWSGHVVSWLNESGLPLHLLHYEHMLADPVGELGAAARFAGLPTSPDVVERAVAATRFEVLQRKEKAEGFRERPPGVERFFRRGVAGGWRDTLSAEQVGRIVRDHGEVMARLGYV